MTVEVKPGKHWEVIDQETGMTGMTGKHTTSMCSRLKVPGGWLVRTVTSTYRGVGVAQTFVADEDHAWRL